MVWQPNILNNCYELSGGYAPRTTHQGLCPGPRWGTSVPQTSCAPTSKSWLRYWGRDGDDWMSDGNEWQRSDAATGNVRLSAGMHVLLLVLLYYNYIILTLQICSFSTVFIHSSKCVTISLIHRASQRQRKNMT